MNVGRRLLALLACALLAGPTVAHAIWLPNGTPIATSFVEPDWSLRSAADGEGGVFTA